MVWEIRRSGYDNKLIAGIVLTGGGSLLNHIDKLTAFYTGMDTRIGVPVEHLAHGYSEQLSSPVYSTAIGLLLKGIKDVEEGRVVYNQYAEESKNDPEEREMMETVGEASSNKWYDSIFQKTKEWFQAEPDAEF